MSPLPERQSVISEEVHVEDWKMHGRWPVYKFNYNGAPIPVIGELNFCKECFVSVDKRDHFLIYLIGERENFSDDFFENNIEEYRSTSIMCMISTTNSAHSLCEILSFVNFYIDKNLKMPVCVNKFFVEFLPLLYDLLRNLLPRAEFIVLEPNHVYKFSNVWLRRNQHFSYLKNWQQIEFHAEFPRLDFFDLKSTINQYSVDCGHLRTLVYDVAQNQGDQGHFHKKVMWIKERTPNVTTPNRAILFSDKAKERAQRLGWFIADVSKISSIKEYISILWNAEKLVISYGGPACTNRFFANSLTNVLLIANKAYEWEYNYPNEQGPYWHIRHSHLFPVEHQRVLLDFPDEISELDIEMIEAEFQN